MRLAGQRVQSPELGEFADGAHAGVFVRAVQIGRRRRLAPGEGARGWGGAAVADPVDAAAGAVHASAVVALAGVAPVEDEAAAVGAGADLDAAEPGVVAEEDVGLVAADVAGPQAFQAFDVGAAAVHVEGEQLVAVACRPLVGLVDHHADVGVAAAEAVGLAVAAVLPGPAGVEVVVVGDGVEPVVDVGVARRAGVVQVRAGHEVPEMAGDGVDEEQFALLVPVVAPGVGGAVGEHLNPLTFRMEAPEAALHRQTLRLGRPRHAQAGRAGMAAAAVQPAVGPPAQAVGEVVVVVLGDGEAVEHHLRRPVGPVVAVSIGQEQQLRRAEQPDPAPADFNAGEHLHVFGEHRARLRPAVPVAVLEDDHAVLEAEVEALGAFGVGVVFRHPHPAARVPGEGDRVAHRRLGGEQGRLEAGRQLQQAQRLRGRRRLRIAGIAVVDGRKFGGGQDGEQGQQKQAWKQRHGAELSRTAQKAREARCKRRRIPACQHAGLRLG